MNSLLINFWNDSLIIDEMTDALTLFGKTNKRDDVVKINAILKIKLHNVLWKPVINETGVENYLIMSIIHNCNEIYTCFSNLEKINKGKSITSTKVSPIVDNANETARVETWNENENVLMSTKINEQLNEVIYKLERELNLLTINYV